MRTDYRPRERTYNAVAHLTRWAGHAYDRVHDLLGNTRKAALRGARLMQITAVPAALGCFYAALVQASPSGLHDVAVREFVFPGTNWPGYIPAVAGWPVLYVWVVARALYLGAPHAMAALELVGAGAALVGLSTVLNWAFQTYRNRSGIWAVRLWALSLALSAFDLFCVAALPPSWGGATLRGFTYGGMLRGFEVTVTVYLVSLSLVVHHNRVRPDLFGAWAKIANPVRQGLILRGAALVTVLPLVLAAQRALIGLASNPPGKSDAMGHAMIWGVTIWCLALVWSLVAGGMAKHLQTVGELIGQIIKLEPPLSEPLDPFGSKSR